MLNFLFGKHKNNLLKWNFDYGPFSIKIITTYEGGAPNDNILISSYILFLARYFYICDDMQIDTTMKHLYGLAKQTNISNLTGALYEDIYQTLDKTKQDAALGLFRIYNPLLRLPPLTYSEENEKTPSYAKYDFQVFRRGDIGLGNIFNMSAGPDIVFLPITVSILYEYISNKLHNKNNIKVLNKSILDLLDTYIRVDCRSQDGFVKVPNEVIKRNKLFSF